MMPVGFAHIMGAVLLYAAIMLYNKHCDACWGRLLNMIDSPAMVQRLSYLSLPYEPPLTNIRAITDPEFPAPKHDAKSARMSDAYRRELLSHKSEPPESARQADDWAEANGITCNTCGSTKDDVRQPHVICCPAFTKDDR